MSRITRSTARRNQVQPDVIDLPLPAPVEPSEPVLRLKPPSQPIRHLTRQQFSTELLSLSKSDRNLLLFKRNSLQNPGPSPNDFNLLNDLPAGPDGELLSHSAAAALVFAGPCAGTAVCVSPHGHLLTCAHCIAGSPEERPTGISRWLLFASGLPVKARCISWDPVRDLALLQITAAVSSDTPLSSSTPPPTPPVFPHIQLSPLAPRTGARLICIGHPGSEDFEAPRPGVATGYDVLHLSEGRFRGLAKGQDPQDNSEIGALMHDCWTYWGHSGAPLIARKTGELVGLHSSWDEETGMRRGVGWEAVMEFLRKEQAVLGPGEG